MSSPPTVTARVTMTIEIPCHSHWSPGTTMEQIRKQAVEDAEGALRSGLAIHGMVNGKDHKTMAVVVGTPKVVAVLAAFEGDR